VPPSPAAYLPEVVVRGDPDGWNPVRETWSNAGVDSPGPLQRAIGGDQPSSGTFFPQLTDRFTL